MAHRAFTRIRRVARTVPDGEGPTHLGRSKALPSFLPGWPPARRQLRVRTTNGIHRLVMLGAIAEVSHAPIDLVRCHQLRLGLLTELTLVYSQVSGFLC